MTRKTVLSRCVSPYPLVPIPPEINPDSEIPALLPRRSSRVLDRRLPHGPKLRRLGSLLRRCHGKLFEWSNLRVYYQGVDGFVYETTNTRSSNGRPWATKKTDLPAVPLGSSLAATFLSDGRKRRVYTTNFQNQLIEVTIPIPKSRL